MKKIGITLAAFALPLLASAQTAVRSVWDIFGFIKRILDTALPLIIAAAVVYFVWGLFQLFLAGDDEKKEKAKSTIIYGVIALFVMISIWGLVNILANTFNLDNTNRAQNVNQQLPNVPNVPR